MKGERDPNLWDKIFPSKHPAGASQSTPKRNRHKIIYPFDDPPTDKTTLNNKSGQLDLFTSNNETGEGQHGNSNPNSSRSERQDADTPKQTFNIPPPVQKSTFIIALGIIVVSYFITKKKQKDRELKAKLFEKEESNCKFQKETPFGEFKKTDVGKTVLFTGEWILYIIVALILLILFGLLVKHINKINSPAR